MSSGRLLCSILLGCGLTCLAVDLAERWLFLGGSNGSISRVNLYTKPLGSDIAEDKDRYVGHSKSVTSLAVCCWEDVLISTSKWEDKARVWDINSHQTVREVKMKGPISVMMVQSGVLQSLSKDPPSSPAPVVKVFKKHINRSSPEDSDKTSASFPIQLRGINPLSNVVGIPELHTMFCPPNFFSTTSSNEDVLLHSLKHEVQELKDVNKKLYSFCMDKLIT